MPGHLQLVEATVEIRTFSMGTPNGRYDLQSGVSVGKYGSF